MLHRNTGRLMMIVFAGTLAAVLVLWSYTSLAADVNDSLTAGPQPGRPNQSVTLTGRNFEPNERVGVWVTYPDFRVYPVAEVQADRNGNVTLTYLPNFVGEATGQYVYTAYGHNTQRQVYAYLQVDTRQAATSPPGSFTGLSVSPNATNQVGQVTLAGRGYRGNEQVSIWVTYPDFSVDRVRLITADSNGNFTLTYTPRAKGNGEYIFTAQGNSSARVFYAELQVGVLPIDTSIPTAVPVPTAVPTPTSVPVQTNLWVEPNHINQYQPVDLTGAGFAANEPVAIWVTYPDARVDSVAVVVADEHGRFTFGYEPDFAGQTNMPAGDYIYTAHGNTSGREVFAHLHFAPTAAPSVVPVAPGRLDTVLLASPTHARQNDTVTLEGRGFASNEPVAIWITYPNFEVYSVTEVQTNADGNFTFPYILDFLDVTFTPTGKYTYTARGQLSGREVYADIQVDIGAAPDTSPGVEMQVTPGRDAQGGFFTIRGTNFGGNEMLALWIRYPDNRVVDQGQIQAGPEGAFSFTLRSDGAPTGRYAFTARGLRTGLNGIVEFDITIGDLTIPRGPAGLQVRPGIDNQRSVAIFEGSGFQPEEVVTIWVTLPDQSTLTIGDVVVDANGGFVVSLYLGEQEPVGRRAYTAYGNTSGLRAITDYVLVPGGPEPAQNPQPDAVMR